MASIQTHLVLQRHPSLRLKLVSGVGEPSVALQEDRRAQVVGRIPPSQSISLLFPVAGGKNTGGGGATNQYEGQEVEQQAHRMHS